MEKKYIFFESPLPLAILFSGFFILFAGVALIALLLPGNYLAAVVFIGLISFAIVSLSFRVENKPKRKG
jgi:membrane protein implicated in regulation of membrane protease activity